MKINENEWNNNENNNNIIMKIMWKWNNNVIKIIMK